MMLAPKDSEKYIKMICIESIDNIDKVWGNCSLIKGNSYDILIEGNEKHLDDWYLVKFGSGLCPHKSKYLKTEAEIRDEIIDNLLKR
jgi:hypothetical protein